VLEHVDLRFAAVVANKRAGDANPGIARRGGRADFDIAVLLDLLGDVLGLACLDVELAFENLNGAEWAHAGLVAIHGRQVIDAALLDEFLYFFHLKPLG